MRAAPFYSSLPFFVSYDAELVPLLDPIYKAL